MTTKHTPTPWHVDTIPINPFSIHWSGGCIAECALPENGWSGMTVYETESNARHIVHCVNMHDQLVEALEGIVALAKDPAGSTFELKEVFGFENSCRPAQSEGKAILEILSTLTTQSGGVK
jgi:hypothetical protein